MDHSKDLEDEPERTCLDDPTNYPDAEDEMTPNVSIVVFLQCLLRLVEFEAVHNRIQLKAEFKNGRYNAYTDGVLRTKKR
jgi:hypothetical protein